jgi:hypothetical protein
MYVSLTHRGRVTIVLPTPTITVVVKWHKNLTAPHEISFINQPINTCGNKCTLLLPHRLKWRWHIYCIIICSWYSGKKNYWPLHTVGTFLDNLLTSTTNTCTYQMNYIYWYASKLSCNENCIKRIKEILFQHSLQTSTFFFLQQSSVKEVRSCFCVEWPVSIWLTPRTMSMGHSPSWEANNFTTSLEIHRILWNLKVHYLVPILFLEDPF